MGRHAPPVRKGPSQRTVALAGITLVIVAVLVATALSSRPAAPTGATAGGDGRALYVQYCAGCHGQNLEGQPNWKQPLANGSFPAPPHDASGHTWHHPDAVLFQITKQGGQNDPTTGYVSGMPGFGSQLSDDQIWAILNYIKSTWPPEVQAAQRQVTQQNP